MLKEGAPHAAFRTLTIELGRPQAPARAASAKAKAAPPPQAAGQQQQQLNHSTPRKASMQAAVAARSQHAELVDAAVESYPALVHVAGLLAPAFDSARAAGFWSAQVRAPHVTFVVGWRGRLAGAE